MVKNTFLFLLIFSLNAIAETKDSIALKYSSYISAESVKKNLSVLASDEYEGRETGKRGQKLAAEFLSQQFLKTGLQPTCSGKYYQSYLLNEKQKTNTFFYVNNKPFKQNIDYYYFPQELNNRKIKTKKIVYLGYGIKDSVYNDYKNASVKNKFIIINSAAQPNKDSFPLFYSNNKNIFWSDKQKILTANKEHVKTVFIIKDDIENEIIKNKYKLEGPSMSLAKKNKSATVFYVSKQLAGEIFNKTKRSDSEIKTYTSKIKVTSKINQNTLSSENVLGYIEGSEYKDECIVISAHYDHLGIKDGKVYNGADDDGSGTVALLEISKAFTEAKKEGNGPKRSILFIAFSGEEKGLLGSSYFVENPVIKLQNIVCDLNIDMIGRIDKKHEGNADYVYLIGSDKLSSELHSISETTNNLYSKLELDYTYNDEKDKNRFYYRSDHYNFAKNKVPVIFYFNGVHEDYHQPTDDVEKINFNKIEKISKLVFFTAWELANRNDRIKVDSNKK